MSKKAYIGVDGIARKIKGGYIGVNGIARKIKKAYIGIGGVARPCWSGGELTYYGTATDLKESRRFLAATTVGNYALFAGGDHREGASVYSSAVVDAYNKSLTRSTPSALTVARYLLSATTVGNYALFAGGCAADPSSVVNAYNKSLTRSTPSVLYSARYYMAATSVGDYAIFAGGYTESTYSGETYSYIVDTYNTSLTKSIASSLNKSRCLLAATTVGNYALFGGGSGSETSATPTVSTYVDAYDTSLTKSVYVLSAARRGLAATTVGNYALFAGGTSVAFGGSSSGTDSAVVDAFNTSLTRSTPTSLSGARSGLKATTLGDYALFATTIVDVYDASLTRTTATSLSFSPSDATTVGNYALFAGGYIIGSTSSNTSSIVHVYTIA